MIIEVLVEIKAWKKDRTFSYRVPEKLQTKVAIGKRVLVPFQKRELEGFILNINVEVNYEVKEIIDVIDESPVLNKELLELGQFIQKKTLCNLISAYQTMLPTALKAKKSKTVNKKYLNYLIFNTNNLELTKKQQEIVDYVKSNQKVLKSSIKSKSILKILLEKDILREIKEEDYRLKDEQITLSKKEITLTAEQEKAVKTIAIKLNNFGAFLLHGVTGSGKTEVYMQIIEQVLKLGKNVIVLVPEISLTPQIVANFKNRFQNNIAILHSGLNDGEKYDEWRRIERKEVSIVIGARSAIFAPLDNLGLIVIDEEHSDTYKQENNPRYNTIELALWRAKYHSCPLILGSATPSVESYVRAKSGIYELVELKKRVNNNLPTTHLIDMRSSIKKGYKILSLELIEAIKKRLNQNEQIIILLNRRGFATNVTCHDCGHTVKCKYCDIPLVYHKSSKTCRCHYCGYAEGMVLKCPNCSSKNIDYFGLGTQKLEEEITKMFTAKVVRMDVDTTSKKGAHAKIINDFMEHKYDILIGTQMIAKGLDFPNVTLVGVINGDASLNMPDFRAGERTYQLLNQIAGRSGRSTKKGEVFIQAFNTEHYSIVLAANNDYENYIKQELLIRKRLNYPPYYNLLLLKISGKAEEVVRTESEKIGSYLRENLNHDIYILGPSPAMMLKINNIYHYQIIIKYKNTKDITESILYIKEKYDNNKINLDLDFNPLRI
ncbi:MAG: primosomal protein N' [Bacilli bacterium]|nr:primosomal protein N' [Bacilli bacterium]